MFIISNKSNERITHAIESSNITEPKLSQNSLSASPCSDCRYYCYDECWRSCGGTCSSISENHP